MFFDNSFLSYLDASIDGRFMTAVVDLSNLLLALGLPLMLTLKMSNPPPIETTKKNCRPIPPWDEQQKKRARERKREKERETPSWKNVSLNPPPIGIVANP